MSAQGRVVSNSGERGVFLHGNSLNRQYRLMTCLYLNFFLFTSCQNAVIEQYVGGLKQRGQYGKLFVVSQKT